jgi:membrane complex biogenesis BtpA family protein
MLDLAQTFGTPKPVFGMVHLAPLPGAPRYSGRMADVLARALQDAHALQAAGVEALVIENFNDEPFFTETTEPETVAAMTLAAKAVGEATGLPLGINVLRNSWKAAMGIAAAVGARFVRINILTDVMITDQGLINSSAAQLVRYRRMLGADDVLIFADINSKHAVPVAQRPLAVVAHDMVERGGADTLLVSGHSSADPPRLEDLQTLGAAAPDTPLIIGSGMSLDTVGMLAHADATIFGFGAKPHLKAPVDPEMARTFMEAVRELRAKLTQ